MDKRNMASIALATLILASSCNSSYEAAGGVTGSVIGSHIGGTIGFLAGSGFYRGESAALGSLIGTGVGAVLGVGIARQTENNVRNRAASGQQYEYTEDDRDYQTGGGATYNGTSSGYSFASCISITDLTYTDTNGDGCLSKNEVIEIAAIIENTSDAPLKNVIIRLTADDAKSCAVSPSLTINLEPGEKTQYTGRIFGKKARKGRNAGFTLSAGTSSLSSASKSFTIEMR